MTYTIQTILYCILKLLYHFIFIYLIISYTVNIFLIFRTMFWFFYLLVYTIHAIPWCIHFCTKLDTHLSFWNALISFNWFCFIRKSRLTTSFRLNKQPKHVWLKKLILNWLLSLIYLNERVIIFDSVPISKKKKRELHKICKHKRT